MRAHSPRFSTSVKRPEKYTGYQKILFIKTTLINSSKSLINSAENRAEKSTDRWRTKSQLKDKNAEPLVVSACFENSTALMELFFYFAS